MEKICSRCKEKKSLDGFYLREGSKDGYRNICKKCDIKRAEKQAQNYLSENKINEFDEGILNKCSCCKKYKPLSDFSKKRTGKYGRGRWCRECVSSKLKNIRLISPNLLKEKNRIWKQNNLERVLFFNCKHRAKKFYIDFDIDITDIVIPKFCPVLGIEIKTQTRGDKPGSAPSVDRLDSTKGYIKGNVKVISWLANTIKSVGTAEQHELVAKYMRENGQS